ncbi:unnamed protein product [Orchesella dallaii]|uniref:Transmembrane protein n=1 Tax=Orchesella dallaii TaxID=48710 RepID=A0ABP1RV41_9HEXA
MSAKCYVKTFICIIWLELFSLLVAATWTAFFNTKAVNLWAYVIFLVCLAFTVIVFRYTKQQISTKAERNEDRSLTLNWISGVCSVISGGLLAGIIIYNKVFLGHLKLHPAFWFTIGIFMLALFLLVPVACGYMCRCSSDEDDIENEGDDGNTNANYNYSYRPPNSNKTLDESLDKMMNHVKNHPLQKNYTMCASNTGLPYELRMP